MQEITYKQLVQSTVEVKNMQPTEEQKRQLIEQYERDKARVLAAYPDALERVRHYRDRVQNPANMAVLFNDVRTEADLAARTQEIRDVYQAATLQGYEQTPLDSQITLAATVLKPGFLEEIMRRIDGDEIVDFEGKPVE